MYSLLSLQADWIFRLADLLRDGAWTSFKDTHTKSHGETHKHPHPPVQSLHRISKYKPTHTHTQCTQLCTLSCPQTVAQKTHTHLHIILLPKPLKAAMWKLISISKEHIFIVTTFTLFHTHRLTNAQLVTLFPDGAMTHSPSLFSRTCPPPPSSVIFVHLSSLFMGKQQKPLCFCV